jgi:hypothetical protein
MEADAAEWELRPATAPDPEDMEPQASVLRDSRRVMKPRHQRDAPE